MGLRTRLFALAYDRMMTGTERAGLSDIRAGLLAAAGGDVLEIGAGTGLNLRHYGSAVRSLTLTEPDPSMFRRLEPAVRRSGRESRILRASAEDLPFADATFDTVVSTLVLCGVEHPSRAAGEMRRVLRPGGVVLLAEHVRSPATRTARMQDRWNWLNRLLAGCDCNRATLRTLERAGFATGTVTHGELPKSPALVRPLVVGSARRRLDSPAVQTHEGSTSEQEPMTR